MLKKLLNFGGQSKSNGYYLELQENESTQTETNSKEPKSATSVEAKKTEPKFEKTVKEKQPEPKSEKTVEEKQPKPAQAKSSQKSGKKKTVQAQNKQSGETTSSSSSVPTNASSSEPPFWVKVMYEKTSSNGKKAESEKTFATDHLMPSPTQSRRRPGPSLDTFRSMARQAKTPRT
jgi:outer membrane biosynthesis protein TonB